MEDILMEYPEIYVFDGWPVIGEMGDQTDLEFKEVCSVCHQREKVCKKLSYRFDIWRGEDIVKGALFWLFSERMKEAFENASIEGINYSKIENEKADYFRITKKGYQKELPDFYKIELLNKLNGPDIWWKRDEVCPTCNSHKWLPTLEGIQSICSFIDPTEEYTPREVYKNIWKGEDMFLLEDYGPPIITEKVADIIRDTTDQEIDIKKAVWV